VAPRGGDLDGALDVGLAADVGEVDGVRRGRGDRVDRPDLGQRALAAQEGEQALQALRAQAPDAADEGGLAGAGGGDDRLLHAAFARRRDHGEHAGHGPHQAVQRQLAQHRASLQRGGREGLHAGQHAERDGQVEARPVLADVGGG
jgi:hypothetical protein